MVRINDFLSKVNDTFEDINNGIIGDKGSELVLDIQELNFYCRRLSTAQIGVVITLGASCLNSDEAYLNIGVWDGFSLLAAPSGAPNAISIGVDNFSEMHHQQQPLLNPQLSRDYGDTRSNFYRALRQCGSPRTSFYEMDWRRFMKTAVFPKGGIGIAYYDGEHTAEAHEEFFATIVHHLSPECLIFVDDTRIDFVQSSVRKFLTANSDFELILELGGKRRRDPAWWGGFMVLGRRAVSV
jgi:hypothetical protein